MPTYEYECRKCCARFERFQSITDKPIRKCPSCGANAVKRLIGPGAGLIFRGSGFYCTDYRKGGSGAARDSAPKPESSTDSKPAGSDAKKTDRKKD